MTKKTACILGGTSDLGKAIAVELCNHGYDLILTERKPGDLNAFKKDLEDGFGKLVRTLVFDAGDSTGWSAFLNRLEDAPDLLVSTVGYLPEDTNDPDELFQTLDANYRGLVPLIQEIANRMIIRGKGGIVGISSVAGDRGRGSNFLYGSAKAGFTAYLDGLRHYCKPKKVHVMTVIPGYMRTKMLREKTSDFLTLSPQKAAKKIVNAYLAKRNRIYVGGIWRWIMLVIRNIPEWIFLKTRL